MRYKGLILFFLIIIVMISGMIWHINYLFKKLEKSEMLEHAEMYSGIIISFRKSYTS